MDALMEEEQARYEGGEHTETKAREVRERSRGNIKAAGGTWTSEERGERRKRGGRQRKNEREGG